MSDPTYRPPQVYEGNLNGTDVQIGTSDTSGKLRLTRTGNTMQAFYWAPSGWQLIISRTDQLLGANCQISMYAGSHNFQGKTAQVAFDNIQIINGNVGNHPITSILQLLLLD